MARIYNRDNVNYSGLIGQAIQNANQTSQLYANKWQPGLTMGQGVSQAGERLQQEGWKEWGAEQNQARDMAKLQAQQDFQEAENLKNRQLQWAINQENNANALKIANLNKATQAEYKMDEYHKGLSNALRRRDEALRLRDMANEGSSEWHAADNAAKEASTEAAFYNARIQKKDAVDNLNKALESGDILEIARARAQLGELYEDMPSMDQSTPKKEEDKSKKEDGTPPAEDQGTETSNVKNPPAGVSWTKIGASQKKALPKQFKNDAEIEKAKANAATIKDPNIRQEVEDAIYDIERKGTIEGNNAKLIAKYDGVTISNREWDKLSEAEKKSILKLMKRSGTGKLTKR